MRQRIFVMACLLIYIPIMSAQNESGCPDLKSAQAPLVGPLRVFNTAEVEYAAHNQHFAAVNELLDFEGVKRRAAVAYAHPVPNSAPIGTAADPIPGYDVRLTTTADGKSYTILATKKDAPCQGAGAATDDRGVIYLLAPMQ